MAFQSALEGRVNTGLAAGWITPLPSKELYKIVLQGHFAASYLTEFRQQLQVQSHLEMLRILVQLGHIQRT